MAEVNKNLEKRYRARELLDSKRMDFKLKRFCFQPAQFPALRFFFDLAKQIHC